MICQSKIAMASLKAEAVRKRNGDIGTATGQADIS